MVERSFRLVDAAGECEIDTVRRELRVLGSAVPIGGRAFEVIEVLAQSPGELVTKDQLMERIWPGAIVTENTLQVHALAIRKALGPYRSLLKTVSGRGYRLLGDWTVRRHDAAKPAVGLRWMRVDGESPVTNFPATVTRLVGRAAAVERLRDLISAYRAVTLTGPGGIGKTSLALKVARGIVGEFADGGWLVELASLADPTLVPAAVVRSLAPKLDGQQFSAEAIARTIGDHHILIVLDNCEHVIGAAANLAETLLRSCPHTTVLATSREILRIEGEFVYRVPPLEVPSQHEEASGDILEHSAVQLFVTRMRSLGKDYRTDSDNRHMVAAICRRLDGIPLAIEFAAARAATLGIRHVAGSLDDRFALLVASRRTAPPRHQTLRATLDWSYDLLTEPERVILRRLAIFAGPFSLQAATAVAADPETELAPVVESLSSLVAKSLVTIESDRAVARYRLLDTTRAYATGKLDDGGERELLGRRHAEYFRDVFERAETEALVRPTSEWLADYTPEIDNLRSALDWAFSPHGGDVSVGIALTAAAVPLWIYLSLVEECRHRVERALVALVLGASAACLEMKLQAALGASLGRVGGDVTEMESAWTRALDLAKGIGNVDYELRALFGLWMIRDQESLALAQQFAARAKTPADRLVSDQMIGHSYSIQGNQIPARRHLERAIANHGPAGGVGSEIVRFQIDHDPMCSLARVLWLQGLPEQAMRMAERLVEREKAQNHANSLCSSLALGACPIALWTGNLHLAEQYIEVLHETSKRHGLTLWHALARAYRGVLLIKRGNLRVGLPQLRAAFEECWAAPTGYRVLIFIAELPEALGRAGQTLEGLVTVQEAIARAERTAEGWMFAELLRVKGELLLQQAMRASPEAEECFRHAGEMAHEQGALAWELRSAMSLARLWYGQNRRGEALALLRPVYDRFTEGFDTADLKAAKALLDTLL
jgi:predicted ATPase/DNA-binding winged helix-turn-helix (wHTH) protein